MRLWRLKLKLSAKAIGRLLLDTRYSLLATLLGALILGIMLWSFNLSLLRYILISSDLGIVAKFKFILDGYASVFTNFDPLAAATLVGFSILMGLNLSVLVYVLRRRVKTVSSPGLAASGSVIAAAIGAGCAACGTSILAPVISAVGATSTVALSHAIGLAANTLGIILILVSLYGLGKQAASVQAREWVARDE